MDKLQKINKFVNALWKFIKLHDIPPQDNQPAWDKIVSDADDLVSEYRTSDPMHKLFRAWVIDYLDYMGDVSKGVPTLMQEANEVKDGV